MEEHMTKNKGPSHHDGRLPSFQAIRGKDEFWDEGIRTTADACEPGNKCRSEVCPEHTPPSVYRRFQGRAGGGKVLDCPLRFELALRHRRIEMRAIQRDVHKKRKSLHANPKTFKLKDKGNA